MRFYLRKSSRIPSFYKLTPEQRIKRLAENFSLNPDEVMFLSSQGALSIEQADKMIENVVGIFSLPIGLGLNFLINQKDYLIPMAVEEPSVVAAASFAAKVVREAGGFFTSSDESIMIGQIQVLKCPDFGLAIQNVKEKKQALLDLANRIQPKMFERGGGAKDLEVKILGELQNYPFCQMLVINLLIDTKDAMGANAINTIMEGISPLIEEITGGEVLLRILSNLSDRRLARANVCLPPELLKTENYSGEKIIDGIVSAQAFAWLDPYRAATHNKGIMNGIDPVVIVTGNDWRAIEAGAHAYASRSGSYKPLTKWYKDEQGNLLGELELPMAVGITGGSVKLHPMCQIALKFLGVKSSRELAEVITTVGLAQNLSALRALATDGIQKGHMALHARSVALTAGASDEMVELIASELVRLQDIKVDRAKELLAGYLRKK